MPLSYDELLARVAALEIYERQMKRIEVVGYELWAWEESDKTTPTPDAVETATRTEPNCGRCIDSGWVWGRQLPGDRADHVTDQKYDCPYCEIGDKPDTTPEGGKKAVP